MQAQKRKPKETKHVFNGSSGTTIRLKTPLSDEVKDELIKEFDSRNIYCRPGMGWWGSTDPEDLPSSHIEIDPKGTTSLNAVDFTEGRIFTFLAFTKDKRTIMVDNEWNEKDMLEILRKHNLKFSPESVKLLIRQEEASLNKRTRIK